MRVPLSTLSQGSRLSVAIIGCGAIAEFFYAPALSCLSQELDLFVTALVDPNPERLAVLSSIFPSAERFRDLDKLNQGQPSLAIVASPQRYHASNSICLLRKGFHVLCEKPLASNRDESRLMVETAHQCSRLLAVGLFRRFWPIVKYVSDLISTDTLGSPVCISWSEGGIFDWPAATPSFFLKDNSHGGVFADIGAHVLDLMQIWFGPVIDYEYYDDSMGGLEANCYLNTYFNDGIKGAIRLSRDTSIANRVVIEFEKGTLSFTPRSDCNVSLSHRSSELTLMGSLFQAKDSFGLAKSMVPSRTNAQSFLEQIKNVCNAIRGLEPLLAPASDAVNSMELIDQCYANRQMLPMPWLTHEESCSAKELMH